MSATSWSNLETFTPPPASTSTASSGDDYFRSFMSSLALGISSSFVWPGSGGGSLASGGESVLGNARFARAGTSAVTGGYGDGFLLLNQNHVSLHHIGSTWTGLVSHSAMVDHGASTGRWLTQSGTFSFASTIFGSSGTNFVTFPTQYAAPASYVQISVDTTLGYILNVGSITSSGFSIVYAGLRGAIVTTTVTWESDGTV